MAASPDGRKSEDSSISVWMELRPALAEFYGIPQETRLLFSALAGLKSVKLAGLLQMSKRPLRGGIYGRKTPSPASRVDKSSRVVVSLKGKETIDWKDNVGTWVGAAIGGIVLRFRVWLGLGGVRIGVFEAGQFADYLWQELFGRTLPVTERGRILAQERYYVCAMPWRLMHMVGLDSARLMGRSRYPRLHTDSADVMIAQTPYPGRVNAKTKLVVHYHDAIPVLMPHTIADRAFHQASHYHALADNVRSGAYFVCVSDATRADLLGLFPEVAERAVTIHNMLPAHYFPTEPEPDRIPDLVRRYSHTVFTGRAHLTRRAKASAQKQWVLSRAFRSEEERAAFLQNSLGPGSRFLLMVSTIEPRKNHARLLAAWEVLHSRDPGLKLILVGHIGWDYAHALGSMLPWIEEGSLYLLQNVPSDNLRLFFRQAIVTVCPSTGEGFDFSGVEAMRCGGVVAASDIPVHREVYGEATAYFDPYDTGSLVNTLDALIYGEAAEARREALRARGIEHSLQYLPERILPQWEAFLQQITTHSV